MHYSLGKVKRRNIEITQEPFNNSDTFKAVPNGPDNVENLDLGFLPLFHYKNRR